MEHLEKLHDYLSSDESPTNSMMLSDLDGFLTGIVCSPEPIPPSEWLPLVWNNSESEQDESAGTVDPQAWAVDAVLDRHDAIAYGLKSQPPRLDPVFWETSDEATIATDWCVGFMEALGLRAELWDELMATPEGMQWMTPVLAHMFDEEGRSLVNADPDEMDELLDKAADMIPATIPHIFEFWQRTRMSGMH